MVDLVKNENEMTGMKINYEVHELNQAKFGLVKLRQSYSQACRYWSEMIR